MWLVGSGGDLIVADAMQKKYPLLVRSDFMRLVNPSA